ncbi:MAG TPA: BON domain-containing protein [Candidatus Binatia bacterium]|nr:BON domain-containing protein [Candidatus Binatia bacterium]
MTSSTNAMWRRCIGTHAAAVVATLVLIGAAHAVSTPSDAWITTKVKLSLSTAEAVSAIDVDVDTVARQVTLHGTVRTHAEKAAAEAVARKVAGVESVRNLLQVVTAAREDAVAARDEETQKVVVAALAAEPSLLGSSVKVQSVNRGVVLLGGKADSLSDHLTAVQLTRDVPGVRRVASEIQSAEALADAGLWKEANIAVGGRSAQSASGATRDLYTTSLVKMRLLADPHTPAMEINVDTRNGTVTLFGIVSTDEGRRQAEAQARTVGGVFAVENQLQVVASGKQTATEVKDDAMAVAVKKNLTQHTDLAGVGIEVKNCVVRLTGAVPSGIERVEAMQIARATAGVCSVHDALTIQ